MKKRTKRLCLFVVILILVSSFIGDNQVYAATKLKNGKYTTCHYAKKKTSYNGSACMYKAKIKGNKLIIWGGFDKIDNDWNILSTKSYKKRIFTVKKNCKIYDGSDYSYEIGDYKKAELSKKDFNNAFNNKQINALTIIVTIKKNKITKIVCLS